MQLPSKQFYAGSNLAVRSNLVKPMVNRRILLRGATVTRV